MAAGVALIIGYPFMRAKGIYFAILTIMLAEIFRLIMWYWEYAGASSGLKDIPPPESINILNMTLSFSDKVTYYYLVLIVVIISLFILYRIERSWFGLMWSSINEADDLAKAVGINIMRQKIFIFVIVSFFMGIAGALYAHYMKSLSPYGTPGSPFGTTASIYTLIYVVVGGAANFAGPIVGATIFTLIPEMVRGLKEYLPLVFGGLLIFIVFVMPGGITGIKIPFNMIFTRIREFRNK
jgi:branched-chain amino acid transport system permease protein